MDFTHAALLMLNQSKATQVSCHNARPPNVALGQRRTSARWVLKGTAGVRCNERPVSSAPNTEVLDIAEDTRSTDEAPPRQCGAWGRAAWLRKFFNGVFIVTVPNTWCVLIG